MRHFKKHVAPVCCERGCENPRLNYGRCKKHLAALDSRERERLRRMTRAERQVEFQKAAQPQSPRWEYENQKGEMELAVRAEVQKS